jgi:hypothetical protein
VKHRATIAYCRCGTPIRVGLAWCDACRRIMRREAAKKAARSRKRKAEVLLRLPELINKALDKGVGEFLDAVAKAGEVSEFLDAVAKAKGEP